MGPTGRDRSDLLESGEVDALFPWFGQEFGETRALMGDSCYSYGIELNRHTLKALFRYSYQQGLCKREPNIEEFFEAASIELIESQT